MPDLVLPTRVNQKYQYSGMDSIELCADGQHFETYPYLIDYSFNSRGFRDKEWPEDINDLRKATWCIGDSFTVGVGQPFAHIWPQVLESVSGRRCINISMDGASNDWIWRRTRDIWTAVKPQHMVIMWSYTHRREIPDPSLSDEQRRLLALRDSTQEDFDHWVDLVNKVHAMNRQIVQSTIPEFHTYTIKSLWEDVKGKDWPAAPRHMDDLASLPAWIVDELKRRACYSTIKSYLQQPPIQQSKILPDVIHVWRRLDWARDHHHFDILTSRWIVDEIMKHLSTYKRGRNERRFS